MLTVELVYKPSDVHDDLKWATKTHVYDTIYTHFQGITNNIYGFLEDFFFAPSFFTRSPPVH